MYFPFFKLKKWGKKTAETRRRNCAALPKKFLLFHPSRAMMKLKNCRNGVGRDWGRCGVDFPGRAVPARFFPAAAICAFPEKAGFHGRYR